MALRIGELLIQRGVATAAQVEAALADRARAHLPLASRLLAAGAEEAALAAVLAETYGTPAVDLSRTTIPAEALDVIPRQVAEGDLILPLSLEGGRIHLAMAHPRDERVVSEVRFVTGREVSVYAALHVALTEAVIAAYRAREAGLAEWRGRRAGGEGPRVDAALPGQVDGLDVLDDVVLVEEPLEVTGGVVLEVGDPEPAAAPDDGRPLALVVDDEPEILKLVSKTLAARGYAVATAVDGAEALAKATALLPAVVLLDAMLPKVHGFEACRRLKSSPRTRHVPVVMMTAIYRGWRFAQDARDTYGAEDYVEKPFRLDDLVRRLEAARGAAAARVSGDASAADAAAPHLAGGRALLESGDARGAAAVLGEAARLAPFSAEAHHLLGRALAAADDGFAAMTALERAVELDPAHEGAARALASAYEAKGFRRKAAESLERFLPAARDEATRASLRSELTRLLA